MADNALPAVDHAQQEQAQDRLAAADPGQQVLDPVRQEQAVNVRLVTVPAQVNPVPQDRLELEQEQAHPPAQEPAELRVPEEAPAQADLPDPVQVAKAAVPEDGISVRTNPRRKMQKARSKSKA